MLRGTYVGHLAHLRGEPALIRRSENEGHVLAQFDNFKADREGVPLAHGWHEFLVTEFDFNNTSMGPQDLSELNCKEADHG